MSSVEACLHGRINVLEVSPSLVEGEIFGTFSNLSEVSKRQMLCFESCRLAAGGLRVRGNTFSTQWFYEHDGSAGVPRDNKSI